MSRGPTDPDLEAADARTLRLAAPELTAELLDRFLAYQRAWLEQLDVPVVPPLEWPQRMTRAHDAAIAASGLSPGDLGQVRAVADDFCRRRWTARQVRHLKADSAELRRLEDLGPLERRYGKQNLSLLLAREAEVMGVYERARRLAFSGPP